MPAVGVSSMFEQPRPPAYPAFPSCQDQGPSQKNLHFTQMIAKGEASKGFTAQTANGTAHDTGLGWNRKEAWSDEWPAREGGAWKGGPSNRTGE